MENFVDLEIVDGQRLHFNDIETDRQYILCSVANYQAQHYIENVVLFQCDRLIQVFKLINMCSSLFLNLILLKISYISKNKYKATGKCTFSQTRKS